MLSPEADGKMAKAGLMPNPTTKERVAKSRAKRVEAGLVRIDIGRIGDEKGINGYITKEQARYLKAKVKQIVK